MAVLSFQRNISCIAHRPYSYLQDLSIGMTNIHLDHWAPIPYVLSLEAFSLRCAPHPKQLSYYPIVVFSFYGFRLSTSRKFSDYLPEGFCG